jgi:hypothetical protein
MNDYIDYQLDLFKSKEQKSNTQVLSDWDKILNDLAEAREHGCNIDVAEALNKEGY